MKRILKILLIVLVLSSVFQGPWKSDVAEAAGEVITYDTIYVPATHITGSRPASYPGDPNWFQSTMDIDLPAYTMDVSYNQVTGALNVTLSNFFLPTKWVINRQELSEWPVNPSFDRWRNFYRNENSVGGYVKDIDGNSIPITYHVSSLSSFDPDNPDYRTSFVDKTGSTFLPWIKERHWLSEYSYTDEIKDLPLSFTTYISPGLKLSGIYFYQDFTESYNVVDRWEELYSMKSYHEYTVSDSRVFTLTNNKAPSLTLTSASGQTIMNETGFSNYNLEGYVQDPDNDTLNVIAEIPNVFYKKISLSSTASPKTFSIPIDAITDGLSPGTYTINVKAVDPLNKKAEASSSITVTKRLKNKAFFLINEPVSISGTYSDYESDLKYAERYKYEQDPNLFDNPMGLISDNGLWRNSKYTSFPYTGAYVASFQNRDNPLDDYRFDEFRKWSRDNLSSMTFLVHRKPIALFTAKLINGNVTLADKSYDLDHITAPSKGIYAWEWQYKKTSDEVWTDGQLSSLPSSDQYDIRLRVRDIDGPDGIGVWSDWYQVTVGSPSNLPPVALFTVTPNYVSHRSSTTIVDQSFDPDNDNLDTYEWRVIKDGWQQVWYHSGGPTTPPNIASFGTGNYEVTLKVHDNRGLWSNPYSQSVQVVNSPPVASFTMPTELYRDSVVAMTNTTPDPDADGEALIYGWNGRINGGNYYYAGGNRNQNINIRSLITQMGLTEKQAVSDGWEMRLSAFDGVLGSNATRLFTVLNHIPSAAITGSDTAFQYNTYTYTSADEDGDPSDVSSLQYYWRITDSDGGKEMLRTQNVQITYDKPGVYTLEHWVVDQIGDKSNIATLKVAVAENLAPSMTLTTPAGTRDNPSIIDAEQEGDPLIKWTYADPENDEQEKYRLEFYTKDGLLAKSVENTDGSGNTRQYKMPDNSLERFLFYTVQGRAFSKNNWSEISNEKAFIIDNPPVPGFTLITDTGKDAVLTPIYRTDVLQITSTAHDDDQPKGDTLTYKYYLKPSGGTEGLISASDSFTKQFTTNDTFTIRQVVTDSLGLWREVSHSFIVKNRAPVVNLTYPTSDTAVKPTISSTMTPIIKWSYTDDDNDEQQRYRVRILDAATGNLVVQSGDQASSQKQWTVPAGTLVENQKYAAEVEAFDGFDWSAASPRKYFMVNLLSVKGGVKHTAEWNNNRQNYNLKMSGDPESPRAYNVFWAGEKFMLQADATGLPDTIDVNMDGGFTAQLHPADSDKTFWTGELYDSSFEKLPNGPVTFTFTAKNEYNTKIDKVTVIISENWSEYFRSHRVK
ncbi:hypothetical protein G5B47_09400 [Paenibacillus sp. 7124]|uniref:PKD domain-containing protein n=1 Tax=Paenibacillus apii TaxID=1850370 RepID=A0A6M1PL85_9BACL|nr:hypothetical protein [Paenibacillus apii]NGM82633.1 hypothetical protein [Paenibacillus apii]